MLFNSILDKGSFGVLVPLGAINKLALEMKLMQEDPLKRKKFKELSLKRVQDFSNKSKYIKQYNSTINLVVNE